MADVNLNQLRQFGVQVTDYIRTSQAELQDALQKKAALEEQHRVYQVKIAEAVDNLVERGVVPLSSKMELFEELCESPAAAATMLVKLSEQVGPPTMGGPGELEDLDTRDAIERFAMEHTY